MRALALLTTVSTLYSTACSLADARPQAQAYINILSGRSTGPLSLFKRQSCPEDHTSCSSLGDAGACCPDGTNCTRDQNGNIACCPTDAICTGVIGGTATATSSNTGFVLGTSTQASPSPTLAAGYSTVSNQYYPFVAIPTTYANSQQCLSAYSTCQADSTACFNSLGGQNGVTVTGVGTLGITQPGVTGALASGASSICSSLYQQGCYGLQETVCSQFGTGAATQTTGFVQANGGQAAAVRCTGALYTVAAAVAGAGVARMAMI